MAKVDFHSQVGDKLTYTCRLVRKIFSLATEDEPLKKVVIVGASADLEGAFKKLELTHLKQEMTAIAQKIAGNAASDQDRARYRELGEKLKFS